MEQSENSRGFYDQSHLPVREQTEALGHAVRAMYLYTGMAGLAAETGDPALLNACKTLWENTTEKKMYVTGGIGSTRVGEAFTFAYDLPNDTAYTETCAAIGLVYFSQAMLAMDNDARYADVIERALYNGLLSGLSHDGKSFFYENPLEITLLERFDGTHFAGAMGAKKLPITQRVECFGCSCCPPNLNRLLASLGNYVYGTEGDTLYVNQFVSSNLSDGTLRCTMETEYPVSGTVSLRAEGAKRIALRIPAWCDRFTLNRPYQMEKGYALVENDGGEIVLELDVSPRTVFADPRILRNAGRLCVMRGPVVYCAEGVDNGANLYRLSVSADARIRELPHGEFGLPDLEMDCREQLPLACGIYSNRPPKTKSFTMKLIPYHAFANRGETDMLVWLRAE